MPSICSPFSLLFHLSALPFLLYVIFSSPHSLLSSPSSISSILFPFSTLPPVSSLTLPPFSSLYSLSSPFCLLRFSFFYQLSHFISSYLSSPSIFSLHSHRFPTFSLFSHLPFSPLLSLFPSLSPLLSFLLSLLSTLSSLFSHLPFSHLLSLLSSLSFFFSLFSLLSNPLLSSLYSPFYLLYLLSPALPSPFPFFLRILSPPILCFIFILLPLFSSILSSLSPSPCSPFSYTHFCLSPHLSPFLSLFSRYYFSLLSYLAYPMSLYSLS